MDHNEIRLWISRILSGGTIKNGKKYQIPTLNEASEMVYQQTFSEAIFLGCFTQEECEALTNPINIEPLKQKVKDLKIELFNLRKNAEPRDKVRQQLNQAKKELSDTIIRNSEYYRYSAEFLASFARDYNEIEFERPTDEQIREIARSSEWYSIWAAQKLRAFPKKLNEDQIALINWTTKYINILKNPKRPETWVLDDDDMLDGWMLSNVQEEEKRPEIHGDGDILIFAKTPGEAQKIFEMNDKMGQAIIKQRSKTIEQKGQVEDKDLIDVKRDLRMEINRGAI